METIEFDPASEKKRWVACFDLLGIKNSSNNVLKLFSIYSKTIEEVVEHVRRHQTLRCLWFSDTFLIYTDYERGFGEIDSALKWTMGTLLANDIPARGSIAYGDSYFDSANHLFMGSALVEAYEYAENQDWIGSVLTPSALRKIEEFKLNPPNFYYRTCRIPFKKTFTPKKKKLPALILGEHLIINGENRCLTRLIEMRKRLRAQGVNEETLRKYTRTIRMIKLVESIRKKRIA